MNTTKNKTITKKTNWNNYPILFSICTLVILTVSFVFTFDRATWVLEVFPILLGLTALIIFSKYHDRVLKKHTNRNEKLS